MELIPRISRAQSMDVLSSMATVAGYKAVLLAAESAPQDVSHAGDRGRDALAGQGADTGSRRGRSAGHRLGPRLGAVVEAYDVRPAVKEQVQSLGAKFLDLPLDTAAAQDQGGYAKAFDENFYKRQRELLLKAVAANDVVITTAAVPGKKAPILITTEMVEAMATGSVILDLAAERGGNCELSQPGKTIVHNGVKILAPLNLPATTPYHASQMYSKNVATLLAYLVKDGKLTLDRSDEIVSETLVSIDGDLVHPKVKEALAAGAA